MGLKNQISFVSLCNFAFMSCKWYIQNIFNFQNFCLFSLCLVVFMTAPIGSLLAAQNGTIRSTTSHPNAAHPATPQKTNTQSQQYNSNNDIDNAQKPSLQDMANTNWRKKGGKSSDGNETVMVSTYDKFNFHVALFGGYRLGSLKTKYGSQEEQEPNNENNKGGGFSAQLGLDLRAADNFNITPYFDTGLGFDSKSSGYYTDTGAGLQFEYTGMFHTVPYLGIEAHGSQYYHYKTAVVEMDKNGKIIKYETDPAKRKAYLIPLPQLGAGVAKYSGTGIRIDLGAHFSQISVKVFVISNKYKLATYKAYKPKVDTSYLSPHDTILYNKAKEQYKKDMTNANLDTFGIAVGLDF